MKKVRNDFFFKSVFFGNKLAIDLPADEWINEKKNFKCKQEKSESKIENFEVLKKKIFRLSCTNRKKFNFLKENSPFEKKDGLQ